MRLAFNRAENGRVKLDINYAKAGDINIAYAVLGNGPIDVVIIPGFESHVEWAWDEPGMRRVLSRLASFSRLIVFDKRGTGLSDRGVPDISVDGYLADTKAVMDAVGTRRAAIYGISEGGATALLFAATQPERTSHLIVYGGYSRLAWSSDYTIGYPRETLLASAEFVSNHWGTGEGLAAWAPSIRDDEDARRRWAQFQRLAATPRDVKATMSAYPHIDVRHALPAIAAPTLIIHRKGDQMVPVEWGRYIAERVTGARYVELEGSDHLPWTENADAIVEEVQEFLTGVRVGPEPTRRLATVVFTDIVGSTQQAGARGDRSWQGLLDRHDAMVRRALERFSGREVKTTGDGFLALFEGPTAAIRFADSIVGGASALGVDIRVGLHTGEIELVGEDIGGIAVAIARRVSDLAGPAEVWVSGMVPGVVFGSGIQFRERGPHSLKGVPGEWPLFSVEKV